MSAAVDDCDVPAAKRCGESLTCRSATAAGDSAVTVAGELLDGNATAVDCLVLVDATRR